MLNCSIGLIGKGQKLKRGGSLRDKESMIELKEIRTGNTDNNIIKTEE